MGDNLGQTDLDDSKLIQLSQEQLAKVKAMTPEQRKSLKIVKVAANQNYRELAETNSDIAYADSYCDKIKGAAQGYYELIMGELPGSRGKTYDKQIDLLKEGQHITSSQAAWTADASARKVGGWEARIYDLWVRVAEVSAPALVLGSHYNDRLNVYGIAPGRPNGIVGLAFSLE